MGITETSAPAIPTAQPTARKLRSKLKARNSGVLRLPNTGGDGKEPRQQGRGSEKKQEHEESKINRRSLARAYPCADEVRQSAENMQRQGTFKAKINTTRQATGVSATSVDDGAVPVLAKAKEPPDRAQP